MAPAPDPVEPKPPTLLQRIVPGAETVDAMADAASAVRRWVSDRHNWTRVLWFSGGVVLTLIGTAQLVARPTLEATGSVTSAVLGTGKLAKKAVGQ